MWTATTRDQQGRVQCSFKLTKVSATQLEVTLTLTRTGEFPTYLADLSKLRREVQRQAEHLAGAWRDKKRLSWEQLVTEAAGDVRGQLVGQTEEVSERLAEAVGPLLERLAAINAAEFAFDKHRKAIIESLRFNKHTKETRNGVHNSSLS